MGNGGRGGGGGEEEIRKEMEDERAQECKMQERDGEVGRVREG